MFILTQNFIYSTGNGPKELSTSQYVQTRFRSAGLNVVEKCSCRYKEVENFYIEKFLFESFERNLKTRSSQTMIRSSQLQIGVSNIFQLLQVSQVNIFCKTSPFWSFVRSEQKLSMSMYDNWPWIIWKWNGYPFLNSIKMFFVVKMKWSISLQ